MWPYVCILNTQNFTSYENTVPEAETQFELPTRSTINYKIILKSGDFNKYEKLLSVSIELLINQKRTYIKDKS